VLRDTEAEVARLGEVALAELVLLDLEAALEDLLGLGAADGDVDGDLLVTADTKGADGVAGLACSTVLISMSFSLTAGHPPLPARPAPEGYGMGVSSCSRRRTVDGGLTAQLLEHLGGASQPVTGLADRDVEDELLDAQLAHGVGALVGAALGLDVLAIGLLLGGFAFGLWCARCQ
jgi:hypothetical protein